MALTIQQADLHDPHAAGAFLALMDLFVGGEGAIGDGSPLAPEVRRRLVPAILDRPDVTVWLAVADGDAVGFAVCIESFSTFHARPVLNLHDMMVHPAHRRRGTGRALLRAVEAHARALGCCKLTLEVLAGNAAAQTLYRAVGFEDPGAEGAGDATLFWQKPLRP